MHVCENHVGMLRCVLQVPASPNIMFLLRSSCVPCAHRIGSNCMTFTSLAHAYDHSASTVIITPSRVLAQPLQVLMYLCLAKPCCNMQNICLSLHALLPTDSTTALLLMLCAITDHVSPVHILLHACLCNAVHDVCSDLMLISLPICRGWRLAYSFGHKPLPRM